MVVVIAGLKKEPNTENNIMNSFILILVLLFGKKENGLAFTLGINYFKFIYNYVKQLATNLSNIFQYEYTWYG